MIEKDLRLIEEAKMVAIFAHRNQTYDIFPYEKHLQDVIHILEECARSSSTLLCGGWLHDIFEDTGITYSKIKRAFGVEVADLAYAVKDPDGKTREEKKSALLKKLKEAGPKALSIKLADRIANCEHSTRMRNYDKMKMYAKEYEALFEALHDSEDYDNALLWERLKKANEKIHEFTH